MINDAPLKNIKADQIVAIGGLTNSLCEAVVAWLQANMSACFDGIRTTATTTAGAAAVGRPPPMCPRPPRCTPHCQAHLKRTELLACTGRVSLEVSNRPS